MFYYLFIIINKYKNMINYWFFQLEIFLELKYSFLGELIL